MLKRHKQKLLDPAETAIPLLQDQPDYCAAKAQLDALNLRLNETDKRRAKALARAKAGAAAVTRSPVERAADLVAGGFVPAVTTDAELIACDEERDILRRAISEQNERIAEVVSALSYDVCKEFLDQHHSAMRAVLAAMEQMHDAIGAVAAIRGKIGAAGYRVRTDILPMPFPREAILLGDPNNGNGSAASFRRVLQREGVV